MADSWEAFAEVVASETDSLGGLHHCALELTQALVQRDADKIQLVTKALDLQRKIHLSNAGRRRLMQKRGFGRMKLREVCRLAPRHVGHHLRIKLGELIYYTLSLRITNENNKALVISGMDRLLKIVDVLQQVSSEKLGTYRRRGIEKKKDASVIVSRQA